MRHHVCGRIVLPSSLWSPKGIFKPRSSILTRRGQPIASWHSCLLRHLWLQPDVCCSHFVCSKCLLNDAWSYCCHYSCYGCRVSWKKIVCSSLDLTFYDCFWGLCSWCCQHYGFKAWIIGKYNFNCRYLPFVTCLVLHRRPICFRRKDIRQ